MCESTAPHSPPFRYDLDVRIDRTKDLDVQCRDLVTRVRPEWAERDLKGKVGGVGVSNHTRAPFIQIE